MRLEGLGELVERLRVGSGPARRQEGFDVPRADRLQDLELFGGHHEQAHPPQLGYPESCSSKPATTPLA